MMQTLRNLGFGQSPVVPLSTNKGSESLAKFRGDDKYKNWFPRRLLEVLNDAEQYGFQHIISWLPDGKAFRVHDPVLFAGIVMPRYFQNQNRYKSFQRQLNLYSFKPVTLRGGKCIRGASYHPLFRRDTPDLSNEIKRSKTKKGHITTKKRYAEAREENKTSASIHEKMIEKTSDSTSASFDGTTFCSIQTESETATSLQSFLDHSSTYYAAGCLASAMMLPFPKTREARATDEPVCRADSLQVEILPDFPAETAKEIINTFKQASVCQNSGSLDTMKDLNDHFKSMD